MACEEFTEVCGYNSTVTKWLQIQIQIKPCFLHRAKYNCNFSYQVQVVVKMKADLNMLEAFINQCCGEMIQVQDRAERRSTATTIALAAAHTKPTFENSPPSDSENTPKAVGFNFPLCFTDLSIHLVIIYLVPRAFYLLTSWFVTFVSLPPFRQS